MHMCEVVFQCFFSALFLGGVVFQCLPFQYIKRLKSPPTLDARRYVYRGTS